MSEYRSQSILIERDGEENPIENKEKGWENRWSGCKKVKLGRRNLFLCGSTSFSSHSLLRGVALNPSIKLNKKNEGWILQDVMCLAEARGSMMIRCRLGAGGALSRLCRGTSLQTLSPRQSSRSLWLSKTTSSASFSSKILSSLFQHLAADQ